ncbi:MAG: general secretion pathway protein GspB [bacterium]|nr:general secretion pathway protein GspB [bacterium]
MPKRQTKLSQDPRVAAVVVILMIITVALRLPALLKETNPAATPDVQTMGLTTADVTELQPPPNLQTVSKEISECRGLVQADMTGSVAPAPTPRKENLRNPFRVRYVPTKKRVVRTSQSDVQQHQPLDSLQCEAVFLGSNACAMINGKVFFVGDTVRGFEVETIDSDGVKLNGKGRTLKLDVIRSESSERSSLVFKPVAKNETIDEDSQ